MSADNVVLLFFLSAISFTNMKLNFNLLLLAINLLFRILINEKEFGFIISLNHYKDSLE